VVSRWGDDGAYRAASAKALGTVLHLHRGTPYIYQAQEIGMTNAELTALGDFTDIQSLNHYADAVDHLGADPDKTLRSMRPLARDNARTPMQWSGGPHAGFSETPPWMAVNPNHARVNVADQRDDPDSVLAHYRELIRLRHTRDLVALGSCRLTHLDHDQLYIIERAYRGERALVVANLSGTPAELPDAPWRHPGLTLALSNYADSAPTPGAMRTLRPWEALVFLSAETGD
jgi:oligo-1,6-glucosidase